MNAKKHAARHQENLTVERPSTPPSRVTFNDVLASQRTWIRALADRDMTHADALRLFTEHGIDAQQNHRFLPAFSVPAAWTVLRKTLLPEMQARNRERLAAWQAGLPGRDVPYVLPAALKSDPLAPIWVQALLHAHRVVGMRAGAVVFDTLSGSLTVAVPGDKVWIDDTGEVRVLSADTHVRGELPPLPWPKKTG